ncbi:hypothetical protein GO613_09325 [Azoarcus communis]|uniref:phage tail tube protein n=1 Tax=Parazoarcus communis TaxID=41977 RepID=UPI001459EB2B|nr:hypothetical protein [Parazoarcus communis]NMG48300.1 hypothetical protein [Parazoarcus communis]
MNGQELKYFSLQGELDLYDRVNGMPVGGMWLGDCSSIEYSPSPQKTDYKENHSGARTVGLSLFQGTEATLAITLHNVNMANWGLMLAGDEVTQATTAVVDKVLTGSTPKVGDTFLLGAYDVGSVTIEDSTPTTPKTLVLDVNYTLDPKTGRGKIINLTTGAPFVGPLLGSYTPGADVRYIKMLTNTEREKWIHISSKNTAVTGMPRMGFDFYLAKILPSSIQFINEARGEAVLNCTILGDPTKQVDGDFGQFGRAVMF